jgi:hypothetical protein
MRGTDGVAAEAVTWNPDVNLHAYEDVEALSNYATAADLDDYRGLLLEKSRPVAECIRDRVYRGTPLKVLELCSGSGRLLYALDAMGILEAGYGVEVSASRHRFAELWKTSRGTTRVHNTHAAVSDDTFPVRGLDLVVMIDGALSYLYPCDPELPARLLRQAREHLAPWGAVLCELDVLSTTAREAMRRDGATRVWVRGDERDAFRYALYETVPVSWERMVVRHTSTYLRRASVEERMKQELYKYYAVAEVNALMSAAGFRACHYGSFALDPFGPDARALVTLGVGYGLGPDPR